MKNEDHIQLFLNLPVFGLIFAVLSQILGKISNYFPFLAKFSQKLIFSFLA